MGKIEECKNICHLISSKADEVALFYSGGKDSIMLLDLMSAFFKKIYLVNMYFVPNLRHVNKYVEYSLNRYSNTEAIFIEHWTVSYIRKSGLYTLPDNDQKIIRLSDVDNHIREKTGVRYTFYGMKQSDSLNRRLFLRQYEQESISKTGKIYPLSKLSNKDVIAYIRLNRLPMPISYNSQKHSQGVFFNTDVFLFLRENYPDDLDKIYKQFPQSKQILFEYDYQNSAI